jgi:hypothetical protein
MGDDVLCREINNLFIIIRTKLGSDSANFCVEIPNYCVGIAFFCAEIPNYCAEIALFLCGNP